MGIADIANETNFTSGNLYKYISSKEEIYQLILLDEINLLNDDIHENINCNLTDQISTFSKKWAEITYEHKRFLKLISFLLTTFEANVSIENLIAFKNEFAKELSKIFNAVKIAFPSWDDKKIMKFVDMQKNYAIVLFPSTSPSPKQREAAEKSSFKYFFPDFISDFSEFINYTVEYLNKT